MLLFGVDVCGCFFCFSTFGSVEVHNLQPEKVQALEAWVIHGGREDSRYILLLCTQGLFYESVHKRIHSHKNALGTN